MLQYILLGSGFAFSAVIQPGPLQAFLFSRVASFGWKRTLPACLAPLLSDGPIALLSIFVLGGLSFGIQHTLRACGGVYLLYLAWTTARRWRTPDAPVPQYSTPQTLLQAALVNVLNPNPYLGWTLVLGPSVLSAWNSRPIQAVVLLVAFYGTMVVLTALLIFLMGTSSFLSPVRRHTLVALSAFILAIIGIYLLTTSVQTLFCSNRPAWS